MNLDLVRLILTRTKDGLLAYLKAMVISSLINMIILTIGLGWAGVSMYGLVAFFIAIVDLMPVLGSGIVLVPWAIIVLIGGNTKLAASLVVLYIITILVKQIVEPLILGKTIGLKPLYTLGITLVSMIVLGPAVGALVGAVVSILVAVFLDLRDKGSLGDYFGGTRKGPYRDSEDLHKSDDDLINF